MPGTPEVKGLRPNFSVEVLQDGGIRVIREGTEYLWPVGSLQAKYYRSLFGISDEQLSEAPAPTNRSRISSVDRETRTVTFEPVEDE